MLVGVLVVVRVPNSCVVADVVAAPVVELEDLVVVHGTLIVYVLVAVFVLVRCLVADGAATPAVGLEVLTSNWDHVLDIGDVLHREVVLTWWQRMV